jgi:hypothetical protein
MGVTGRRGHAYGHASGQDDPHLTEVGETVPGHEREGLGIRADTVGHDRHSTPDST